MENTITVPIGAKLIVQIAVIVLVALYITEARDANVVTVVPLIVPWVGNAIKYNWIPVHEKVLIVWLLIVCGASVCSYYWVFMIDKQNVLASYYFISASFLSLLATR